MKRRPQQVLCKSCDPLTGVKIMGDIVETIHPGDRISNLPDFIVHHIMSYLSAKEDHV
ncbi:hypothetical protein ACOSQ2_020793 [Xanthoceras sorbifolium]